MCPVSKGFDEYGNYGENNPPVAPTEKIAPQSKEIRPMTEEERQRAKEREKANKVSDDTEPFSIVVDTVTDHEDGSAGITVTMSDKAQASVIELGLQFIFTCAAAKVDIQDALDGILGDKELLWAAENDAKEAEAYAGELEAKLAVSVEALRVIEDASRFFARDRESSDTETLSYAHETTRRLCSTTLAELTGGNDE